MQKRIINIILSAICIILTSPVMIILSIYLLISRKKIISQKVYCCKGNRIFNMYTFNLPYASNNEHSRLYKAIIEIPALWNVVKGEMSIVGPSAMTPDELDNAKSLFPDYDILTKYNPGLLSESRLYLHDTNKSENLLSHCECNTRYIRNQSMMHDIEIIADSILILICGK